MLRVKKNGLIKGGEINLVYDADNENFAWYGYVKVGVGPIIKKVTFNDDYSIPRDMMRSDSLFVGKRVERSGVILECVSVHDKYAMLTFDSEDVDGVLTVSREKMYLEVTAINASGKYQGQNLKLEAQI
jgi:hypothetical protein